MPAKRKRECHGRFRLFHSTSALVVNKFAMYTQLLLYQTNYNVRHAHFCESKATEEENKTHKQKSGHHLDRGDHAPTNSQQSHPRHSISRCPDKPTRYQARPGFNFDQPSGDCLRGGRASNTQLTLANKGQIPLTLVLELLRVREEATHTSMVCSLSFFI